MNAAANEGPTAIFWCRADQKIIYGYLDDRGCWELVPRCEHLLKRRAEQAAPSGPPAESVE